MLPPTIDLILHLTPKIVHFSQITPPSVEEKSKFEVIFNSRLAEIDRSLPLKKRLSKAMKIQRVIDKVRNLEKAQNPTAKKFLDQAQSKLDEKMKNIY